MRILITGASGLLGLNLALEARREHQVYGVVHRHEITTQAFEVLHGDLLAPGALERILETVQPDWVLHCAALAELDACESDPLLAEQLNTQLPGKLAQLAPCAATTPRRTSPTRKASTPAPSWPASRPWPIMTHGPSSQGSTSTVGA